MKCRVYFLCFQLADGVGHVLFQTVKGVQKQFNRAATKVRDRVCLGLSVSSGLCICLYICLSVTLGLSICLFRSVYLFLYICVSVYFVYLFLSISLYLSITACHIPTLFHFCFYSFRLGVTTLQLRLIVLSLHS